MTSNRLIPVATVLFAASIALHAGQQPQPPAQPPSGAANLKEKPVDVPDPDGQIVESEKQAFKIEIVARNLETPWALAFLPDGRLLITERAGRIRIVEKNGTMAPEPVKGLPKVWEKQDGGLFDVEV